MESKYKLTSLVVFSCTCHLMLRCLCRDSVCGIKNENYYDDGDVVNYSCDPSEILILSDCKTGKVHPVVAREKYGKIDFTSDRHHGVKGHSPFDHTVIGWYNCMSGSTCSSRNFIFSRRMVASRYDRNNIEDVFTCETPFPDMVQLEMYINGVVVSDHNVSIKGTIRYAAPVIHTATCVGFVPCVNRLFTGHTFKLHDDGFTFVKNQTGHLGCYRNGWGTTSLRLVRSDIRVTFSEFDVTTAEDRSNDSVSRGWCVTVSNDSVYISDAFTLNRGSNPYAVLGILGTSTGTFISDTWISRVSVAWGLYYLIIPTANVFFVM
ncbi:b149.5 [miniopterid betaherpesvirus 1]|uniref:B149.5 n=1 Tax=miniopterid betaherpesvirus 1 TaxID=3070189 RepID=I3VQD9_9BETA|nr:b149.5 [miniopterid betaherpesvirus 1]AFK83983.1 b149.5 [miniopterid betaherpesvirus 1]